jgi:hypothetical protein
MISRGGTPGKDFCAAGAGRPGQRVRASDLGVMIALAMVRWC